MTAPRVILLSSDAMDLNVYADSLAELLYRLDRERNLPRPRRQPATAPGNHFLRNTPTPPCQRPITTLIARLSR
jgi:hypothetical protein